MTPGTNSEISARPQALILALVVLYKMTAESSPALKSILALRTADPSVEAAVDLMVCDNTPWEQEHPTGFKGIFRSDTSNPGLAPHYNEALAVAAQQNIPWLLLLDQDTTLTAEYLDEVLRYTAILREDSAVVGLVPKLLQNGVVQSPHPRPTYKHPKIDSRLSGLQQDIIYAFNSASVLRVSALNAIGGFPEKFWLDFLDHATFYLLQRRGGRLFVLSASLLHDLSANSVEKLSAEGMRRYQNTLNAEWTFYRMYGTFTDRIYLRIRLLRGCLGKLIKRKNPRESLQLLKAACRL